MAALSPFAVLQCLAPRPAGGDAPPDARVPRAQDDAEAFSKRVDAYLKPAIVQLAVAVQGSTGSTMLWKPLNHQLLMRTRHDSPMVRFAALQITKALVERLGEEYLMLVPETLPFVVEVLEDMDEEVEAAARSLVAVLETLLGESLNEYLTQ
jgi:U3 small nucleolar RNA-associated protein 10